MVIVLAILGFPVALILAWAYELTPDGIRRTVETGEEHSRPSKNGNRPWLGRLVIFVLLGATGYVIVHRFQWKRTSDLPTEKSIAVLPFDNFSDEKENAFFADGIQDDILTSLARIHGLKVISRTSVVSYRGANKNNIRQIAQALGVANILEGSVRRGGNRVVVTVQLIDARNDRHLWANRYDRPLVDSLGLQGELAEEIASELRVTLSSEEKSSVETRPTNNPDAYVLYLKARGYETGADRLFEDYSMAERLYREAIEHDPGFALAHARLSTTVARIYHWFDSTEEMKRQIRSEAERSLELEPRLGEGHLALALYFYWAETNYEKALEEFGTAATVLPNESEIRYFAAAIRRRQGRFQENLDLLQKSQSMDPANANIAEEIAYTHAFLHDWPEAMRTQERVIALAPDSVNARIGRAYLDFWANGDVGPLGVILGEIAPGVDPAGLVTRARWDLAMIQRDYDVADRVMTACPLDLFQSNGQPTPKSFYLGCTALARGDRKAADGYLEQVRPTFEEAVRRAPNSAIHHANLGFLYALLDRNRDAIREGYKAVQLQPDAKDAVNGPWMRGFLAMIHARAGNIDSALPLLEDLLATPGPVDNTFCSITHNDLRYRWEWDLVRNDPRFQKLVTDF